MNRQGVKKGTEQNTLLQRQKKASHRLDGVGRGGGGRVEGVCERGEKDGVSGVRANMFGLMKRI